MVTLTYPSAMIHFIRRSTHCEVHVVVFNAIFQRNSTWNFPNRCLYQKWESPLETAASNGRDSASIFTCKHVQNFPCQEVIQQIFFSQKYKSQIYKFHYTLETIRRTDTRCLSHRRSCICGRENLYRGY